jgi:hypothetical protein
LLKSRPQTSRVKTSSFADKDSNILINDIDKLIKSKATSQLMPTQFHCNVDNTRIIADPILKAKAYTSKANEDESKFTEKLNYCKMSLKESSFSNQGNTGSY